MNSGIYFLFFVTLLIFLVLSLPTISEDGFLKTAQAHSKTVPVRGITPFGIAYNELNNNMYVANAGSSTVSAIGDDTESVELSILVGNTPAFIAHVPSNVPSKNKLYVSNAGSDSVYVISENKVIKDIPVGDFPIGIAYNPSNNDIYVVNYAADTISVIDTTIDSVIDTIPLRSILPQPPNFFGPYSITYDERNGGMYVGGSGTPQVSVINTASNADVKDLHIPPPILRAGESLTFTIAST